MIKTGSLYSYSIPDLSVVDEDRRVDLYYIPDSCVDDEDWTTILFRISVLMMKTGPLFYSRSVC